MLTFFSPRPPRYYNRDPQQIVSGKIHSPFEKGGLRP
jgi:hypothetical protein